eukprot:CAMPEP_0180542704 /NCGR_PEP_ID=MMETSP1036_2-20121128/68597_1 /TAXON_ID=632150 /ORGANISM="Azadinium spinosum, Strain 3D9" /LENGTH=119 /DNA_ID=CAMNT_0022557595 /DNA_START=1 /DNA_END=360 /DNA_ORIENTATION=+
MEVATANDYMGEQDDLMPLEGLLVEITGMKELVEPDPVNKQFPDVESMDASGQMGRVTGWDADRQKYIVQTFSGMILHIPEANLIEFEPPEAEDGGFDVAWPSGPTASSVFASMVRKLF